MQRFKLFLASASLFALPLAFTNAQGFVNSTDGSAGGFTDLMLNIGAFINTYLIPFVLMIGFVVFVWGMFKYFIAGAADEEARGNGKSLMIYAVLAFVLILSFWGLINFLTSSVGLEGQTLLNTPSAEVVPAP